MFYLVSVEENTVVFGVAIWISKKPVFTDHYKISNCKLKGFKSCHFNKSLNILHWAIFTIFPSNQEKSECAVHGIAYSVYVIDTRPTITSVYEINLYFVLCLFVITAIPFLAPVYYTNKMLSKHYFIFFIKLLPDVFILTLTKQHILKIYIIIILHYKTHLFGYLNIILYM